MATSWSEAKPNGTRRAAWGLKAVPMGVATAPSLSHTLRLGQRMIGITALSFGINSKV